MAGLGKIEVVAKPLEPEVSKPIDNKSIDLKIRAIDTKDKMPPLKTFGGIRG